MSTSPIRTQRLTQLLLAAFAFLLGFIPASANADTPENTETVLKRLAEDYAHDPARIAVTFGVTVKQETWTVEATADGTRVVRGAPKIPAFAYKTDAATLQAIATGRMNGLTAMAQARDTDPTPMTLEMLNGFKPGTEFHRTFLSVTSHFWTTGQPEITPFGFDRARTVHGGQAVATYYEPGFRSAWYGILPGQHVNKAPKDQTNAFGSLFIVIKAGTARARLGGNEVPLTDNTSIYVPAGMTHEFWNPGNTPAEMIMLAFGLGA